jgi:hypothetical protein
MDVSRRAAAPFPRYVGAVPKSLQVSSVCVRAPCSMGCRNAAVRDTLAHTTVHGVGEGAVQAVCSWGWRCAVFGTDKTTETMDRCSGQSTRATCTSGMRRSSKVQQCGTRRVV